MFNLFMIKKELLVLNNMISYLLNKDLNNSLYKIYKNKKMSQYKIMNILVLIFMIY